MAEMLRYSATRTCVAAVMVAVTAACTTSPTSPSQTAPPIATSALQQMAIPVPAGIAAPTPIALGATRFVAFGDSITWGILSSFDGRFLFDGEPGSYPVRLQRGLELYSKQSFVVINRGVPGETASHFPGSSGGVDRIAAVLATDRPQALLLLEGINDLGGGGISIDDTIVALRRIIDTSLQRSVPVLVATMFQTYPRNDEHTNAAELVPEFNQRIRQLAAGRQNVTLVDLEAAFGSDRALVGGDGLHPSPDGYGRMASEFLQAIQRAFPIRGSFQ